MSYSSLNEITQRCNSEGIPFWKAVQYSDMEEREVTEQASFQMMQKMWNAMKAAGDSYDKDQKSRSGLVGGMGGQMRSYMEKGDTLSGDFMSEVIAQALEMGESNACMHRIVAAPTAGACGVLPAVLLPIYSRKTASDTEITEAMYTAAGIGQVIALLLQVRQAVVRLKSARHRQWLRGRWYPSGEERQSRSHMRLLWRSKIFSGLSVIRWRDWLKCPALSGM